MPKASENRLSQLQVNSLVFTPDPTGLASHNCVEPLTSEKHSHNCFASKQTSERDTICGAAITSVFTSNFVSHHVCCIKGQFDGCFVAFIRQSA